MKPEGRCRPRPSFRRQVHSRGSSAALNSDQRIASLFRTLNGERIVVLGSAGIDTDVWGVTTRADTPQSEDGTSEV